MKLFKSPVKNTAYLLYRLITPVFDPIRFYEGIVGYPRYIKQLIQYKKSDPRTPIRLRDLYPVVNESSPFTPFDAHYYFQGIWLLKELLHRKPPLHVDVASKYEISGYISLITMSEFVDFRPINTHLKNLKITRGDILHLPYASNSIPSISSLHVVEHIGLGRYGDEINTKGTELACKELSRVTKTGGLLYLSVPIGKPRVCFNAHRIFDPESIIQFCKPLELLQISVVDDNGKYITNTNPKRYKNASYSCGLYIFKKP